MTKYTGRGVAKLAKTFLRSQLNIIINIIINHHLEHDFEHNTFVRATRPTCLYALILETTIVLKTVMVLKIVILVKLPYIPGTK